MHLRKIYNETSSEDLQRTPGRCKCIYAKFAKRPAVKIYSAHLDVYVHFSNFYSETSTEDLQRFPSTTDRGKPRDQQ